MHTANNSYGLREEISVAAYAFIRRVDATAVLVANTVATWSERARARRDLGELSDRSLADMGLDRGEVMMEIGKPFWRA